MPHLTTRLSKYLTRHTSTSTTNVPESRVKKYHISRPIMLEREEEEMGLLTPATSAAPVAVPVARAVAIAVPAQGNLDSDCAATDSGMRDRDIDLEWERELDGHRYSGEELYTDIDDILDIYRSRPDSRFPSQYQFQYRYNSHTGHTPPPPPPTKHVRVDMGSPESVYTVVSGSSSSYSSKSAHGSTTTSTSGSTTAISAKVQRFENTPPPAPSYAKLSFGEVWGVGSGGAVRWGGPSALRVQEMRGGGARGYRGL